MITIVAIIIAILVAFAFLAVAGKPKTFRVERSTTIQAPPEKLFGLISDFHRWDAWSPWEKLDPALKRTHSGPPNGRGAVYEWEGNKKVGKGRMEIMDATPPSKVVIKLDFLKPFEAHNTAEFLLASTDKGTHVTWIMQGPNTFMTQLMGVFMSMDKMVGKDFETGLANMRAVAET